LCDLAPRHPDVVELDPIETSRVLPKRRVPSGADVIDDRAHLGDGTLVCQVRSGESASKFRSATSKVKALQHRRSVSATGERAVGADPRER
jgi:hypothetical protein